MSAIGRVLSSRWGIIITGIMVGVLAPVLVKQGNPGNMGICVACFSRDIAGAVGLHRAGVVQYIRPEIIGFVLGSLVSALIFREFRPRTGSSPVIRFLLGALAMIGALMFLGCPWRAYLRLSGGDWNAIFGILGLVAGIGVGVVFLRRGFSLGRAYAASRGSGLDYARADDRLADPADNCAAIRARSGRKSHRAGIFLGERSRQPARMDLDRPRRPGCWLGSWPSAAGSARSGL